MAAPSSSPSPSPSSRQWAQQADDSYTVNTRAEFRIPTRRDLARASLLAEDTSSTRADGPSPDSIYLCGNSLGLQPARTAERISQYLRTWATQGVFGHFKPLEGSPLPTWLNVDDEAAAKMAPIVGASKDEVAIMQTLTANLHLLMAAFYTPSKERYKIIIESKAFPSDHYAVESQLRLHGIDPSDSMIFIEPLDPNNPILSTSHILSVIDAHASSTALLLLPGIQFYTGQFFDIPRITSHAQSLGITVGWDLAHAVGNVLLSLHDWNVDFAAWCSYKYLNGGPGCIGGAFVHSRHASVARADYRPRLSGWWGNAKSSRFAMTNAFEPIAGAKGYQLSNPSALDITALNASLEVFGTTSMAALRAKSLALTQYLEDRLLGMAEAQRGLFSLITPRDPQARGAQLSVKLAGGLLGTVMQVLNTEGVVVDEREPDVIRVAPAPLYNTFTDVWDFVDVFGRALDKAVQKRGEEGTHDLA